MRERRKQAYTQNCETCVHALLASTSHLRVVDVDGAGLALAVEAEKLLPDGLGEVQGHVQRADDTRVSVGQEVLRTAEGAAAAAAAATGNGGNFQRRE